MKKHQTAPCDKCRCWLCHERAAYCGAIFCGAACIARWEAGERPEGFVDGSRKETR